MHKISADIVKVMQAPDLKARLADLVPPTVGTTSKQFDAYIRTEIEK